MKNTVTTVIHPFKLNSTDEVTEVIRKILVDNRMKQNNLLNFTNKFLNYIDENKITCKNGSNTFSLKAFLDQTDITLSQLNVIMEFLFNEKLIGIIDCKVQITYRGKLFLISDNITSTIEMVRYYWEKCDWKLLAPYNEPNKFLNKEARRYFACLLLQSNNIYLDLSNLHNKYENLDLVYGNSYSIAKEMLNDKSIMFILENIFEPVGLVNINIVEDDNKIKLTNIGIKVFDYYSFNMIDEYHKLLEDSWECFDRGNFQEAYDIAKSILSVDCNLVETYNVIGCVHIKKKDYNTAQLIFDFALYVYEKLDSNFEKNKSFNADAYISIYYNLGLCYYYLGNFIKAMHIFADIRRTTPYKLENVENIISTIKENIIIS